MKGVIIYKSKYGSTQQYAEWLKEATNFELHNATEVFERIKIFPVGGRYLFKRMSFIDRNIIKLVAWFSRNPDVKKNMLIEKDEVDKNNLQEIIDYIDLCLS
ncbi:MAG: hypothetical protein ACQEQG_10785 [Bacillota bacterium]